MKALLQGRRLAAGIRSLSARKIGFASIAACLIIVCVATPAFAAHAEKTTTVTTTVTATVTSIKTTTSISTSTTTKAAVTVTSTKNYTTTRPQAVATVTATKTMTQPAAAATVTVSASKSGSADPRAAQSSPQSSGGFPDTLLYFLAGVGILVTAISVGMLAFRERRIEDYGREAPGRGNAP